MNIESKKFFAGYDNHETMKPLFTEDPSKCCRLEHEEQAEEMSNRAMEICKNINLKLKVVKLCQPI